MSMPCYREGDPHGPVYALGLDLTGPYATHIADAAEYADLRIHGVVKNVNLEDVPVVTSATLKRYRRK